MRSFSRRVATAVVALILAAAPAAPALAQDTGFFARLSPGAPVDGRSGCVWKWSAATVGPWGGWYQSCGVPLPEAQSTPPVVDDPCAPWPNPYTEGARMIRCIDYQRQQHAPDQGLPTFKVGTRYTHAYADQRMIVLSVTLGLDGVQVITGQWLTSDNSHETGDVFAFRNVNRSELWREDATAAEAALTSSR